MNGGRLVLIPTDTVEPSPVAQWFMEKALGPLLIFAYGVAWPSTVIGILVRAAIS